MGNLGIEMATRNASGLPGRPEKSTEFQLHKGNSSEVIDYTERRLLRYAVKTNDPQQRMILLTMVDDYRQGHIAIAWRRGQPVYVKVTKEG